MWTVFVFQGHDKCAYKFSKHVGFSQSEKSVLSVRFPLTAYAKKLNHFEFQDFHLNQSSPGV